MGSKQLSFEVSSWGVTPGTAVAVGGVLVVVMIMAATAICLMCYYWGMLLKKTLYEEPLPPPSPPPLHPNFPPPSQIAPSDYKILMMAEPACCTCLPSAVVLMPGKDTPTFLALPCNPSHIDVNVQDNIEIKPGFANSGAIEVKVEA